MSSPQGMTELQELMDQIRQLQTENEQLKTQGQDRNRGIDAATVNSEPGITAASTDSEQSVSNNALGYTVTPARYVYVPRERKCSKFTGKLSVDLITLDQWVSEARRCLEVRPMSNAEQVLFLYDHLEGGAKAEVEFHEVSNRDTAEKIFKILTENFSCSQSYVAAQLSFFQRHQKEGESLRDFSHALKSLMDAVIKKTPGGILNHDLVLRDQFAENVNDDMLRRELKRRLALDPQMSFLSLRSIAIKWGEEGKQGMSMRPRAFSFDTYVSEGCSRGADSNAISVVNTEMTELKECLRRQQTQLDAILSQLNSSRPQGNPRGGGGQSKPYRFQSDGKPICIRCNRAGHIARYCRIDPNSDNVVNQVGQRAVAQNQLVESSASLQLQEN
ncbi:uncharacterized protein [Paramisgurnus dabryanus]|uniref:uncharacterized protein isoform X1 n=1 Tax=Paramisgurnus dabryanus TaxID=90735 RepID=UPI003CCF40E2